jgi:hypothetical protein
LTFSADEWERHTPDLDDDQQQGWQRWRTVVDECEHVWGRERGEWRRVVNGIYRGEWIGLNGKLP